MQNAGMPIRLRINSRPPPPLDTPSGDDGRPPYVGIGKAQRHASMHFSQAAARDEISVLPEYDLTTAPPFAGMSGYAPLDTTRYNHHELVAAQRLGIPVGGQITGDEDQRDDMNELARKMMDEQAPRLPKEPMLPDPIPRRVRYNRRNRDGTLRAPGVSFDQRELKRVADENERRATRNHLSDYHGDFGNQARMELAVRETEMPFFMGPDDPAPREVNVAIEQARVAARAERSATEARSIAREVAVISNARHF